MDLSIYIEEDDWQYTEEPKSGFDTEWTLIIDAFEQSVQIGF